MASEDTPKGGPGLKTHGLTQPPQGKGVVEPSGIEPPTGPDLQSVSVRQGSRRSSFRRQLKDLRVPEVRWRPLRFAEVRPEIVALLPRLLPREQLVGLGATGKT